MIAWIILILTLALFAIYYTYDRMQNSTKGRCIPQPRDHSGKPSPLRRMFRMWLGQRH